MMVVTSILISLAVSGALAAYMFYAFAPVPSDIEQGDHVFWIFAKTKFVRGLVSFCLYITVIRQTGIRLSISAMDINSCCIVVVGVCS